MSPSRGKKPTRLTAFILLALCFIIQCFLWHGKNRLKHMIELEHGRAVVQNEKPWKRSTYFERVEGINMGYNASTTADPVETEDAGGTLLGFDYWAWYSSATVAEKPFVFTALVLWAIFLFATIGITASDFFCPNLATVADRLGMGESTAGVTFLAFGNGSPDVFSTFSALKSNTFSLAIGELLGASAFIVSVVVGSMALVQPFQVPRWPFIRDVGFFTACVVVLVGCLGDGKLHLYEAAGLVAMYVVYVGLVVGGNWHIGRRRRKAELQEERAAEQSDGQGRIALTGGEDERPVWAEREDDRAGEDHQGTIHMGAKAKQPGLLIPDLHSDTPRDTLSPIDAQRPGIARTRSRGSSVSSHGSHRSHSPPPSPMQTSTRRNVVNAIRHSPNMDPKHKPLIDTPRPTFSLLGAIEFRDAINALRRESIAAGPDSGDNGQLSGQLEQAEGPDFSDYFGPITPFPSGHYHSFAHGHGPQHARYATASPSRRHVSRNRSISGAGGLGGNRTTSPSPTGTPGAQTPRYRSHSTVAHLGNVGRAISTPAVPLVNGNGFTKTTSIYEERRGSAPETALGKGGLPRLAIPEPLSAIRSMSNSPMPMTGFETEARGIPSPRARPPGAGHRAVPSVTVINPDASVRATLVEAEDGGERRDEDYLLEREEEPEHVRKRDRVWSVIRSVFHTLFPALQDFRHKSMTGRILGVFATPAILALTVTLPVVDDQAEGCSVNAKGISLDDEVPADYDNAENGLAPDQPFDVEAEDRKEYAARAGHALHHLVVDGGMPSPRSEFPSHHHHTHGDATRPDAISPTVVGYEGLVGKDDDEASTTCHTESDGLVLLYNKYLTALQCVLGTLFVAQVFLADQDWAYWAIPGLTGLGAVAGAFVLFLSTNGQDPLWRLVRCFGGFIVAMTWIAAIADEVVDILQVFGRILGLSNAIIGLTIFAIGNSSADLIANLTVASFAPSMSYAACFGGPMLNILLGIGGAGTYVILLTGHPYEIHFSPTLWVSAFGLIFILVTTLVFIPYNGYMITRKWAVFLIAFYVCITVANIVVETRRIGL